MEELMQYVWRFRLWPQSQMVTVDGRRINIIDVGTLNRDSGPDFFNAKISIDGQIWSGDVEIHIKASDWHRHGHDRDRAYDSVVLHVVEKDDQRIHRSNGEEIPQMVMTCARDFSNRYHNFVNDPARELPCSQHISALPRIYVTDWINALAHERLFTKSDRAKQYLAENNGNWTYAIYIAIARALGFNTNSEPFQLLAKTTPLKCMLRHSDELLQIEALLFGQAGFLAYDAADEYQQRLKAEYQFLSKKYNLHPSSNIAWKMARMRPQNFPHRRIAALAQFIHNGFPLSNKILSAASEEEIRAMLNINLSGYWANHYNFSSEHAASPKAFSNQSITVLIINAIIPIIYAFAEVTGDEKKAMLAKDLMHTLKPEDNSIIDIFRRAGFDTPDAFTTQALIQLRKEYCIPRKCLFCRLGHKILSQQVNP